MTFCRDACFLQRRDRSAFDPGLRFEAPAVIGRESTLALDLPIFHREREAPVVSLHFSGQIGPLPARPERFVDADVGPPHRAFHRTVHLDRRIRPPFQADLLFQKSLHNPHIHAIRGPSCVEGFRAVERDASGAAHRSACDACHDFAYSQRVPGEVERPRSLLKRHASIGDGFACPPSAHGQTVYGAEQG